MGISTTAAGLELAQQSNEPIRINGIPGSLVGNIQLQNTTASKLTLKSMPLSAPDLQDATAQPLQEVRIAARLYPGESGNVAFEFPVAATTPPGLYKAELKVGNATRAAQIRINPTIELTLTPDEITLYTEGNSRFEIEFAVTNEGNIAVNMGNRLSATLQTEAGAEGQLLKALSTITRCNDENRSALEQLICSMAELQPGEMTMSWDNSRLEPGNTLIFNSTIELPKNLPPNRHFFAEFEILSETLQVDVYTYGAEAEEDSKPKRG